MVTAPRIEPARPVIAVELAGQQRKIPVTRLPFTIGRADDCDAVIADFRVSRLHARIQSQGEDYFIEDAGSRHGIFVNGQRCERAILRHADVVTFGVPGLRILFEHETLRTSAAAMLLTRFAGQSDTSELEKLRLFLEAARTLGSGLVVQDVLRNMLDYALRITRADRGFVYLRDRRGEPALACGLDNKGNQLTRDPNISQSVIHEALYSAAEFITGDATQQSMLAARQSILLNELRTIIAIPLRAKRLTGAEHARDVEGVLYLDSQMASQNLSGVSPDVLRALAAECAAVLESARLMEAEQAARQYRQELEIAAGIQRSLSSVAEVTCAFARAGGRSIPCKEVGGDFFDIHVAGDSVTVVVVDVSGKGISAALLASVIHGMFYAQVSTGGSLVDAVSSVNRFLCSRVAGQKYATLLAAQLRRDGTLDIVNCGHVPAIIAGGGTASLVPDGDLPVGLIADASFHVLHQQLAPGSRLCMITDGVSESENAEGAEFGMQRVLDLANAPDPIASILTAVTGFCGQAEAQDDRTILVLERTL